ncbi:hypothetical protein [Rhizobium leguminosarum]|uniref:hypothetical protein n=1 Tax=Rhizobium leguminosarum TaxID=384 RepID=UPI001441615A|nr:hypothetical protein [Rhizobium leguminosarum]NKL91698.1 hypothetical protein [Rhizobium leguminosarum bv. viciae]
MSHDKGNEEGKAGNVGPISKSEHGSEKLVGASSKTGLESGQVGRKIVGQGRRRETLKKRAKDPD